VQNSDLIYSFVRVLLQLAILVAAAEFDVVVVVVVVVTLENKLRLILSTLSPLNAQYVYYSAQVTQKQSACRPTYVHYFLVPSLAFHR